MGHFLETAPVGSLPRTATRLLAHQQWQRIRQSLEEDGLAMESDDVVEVTGSLEESGGVHRVTMSPC